MPRARLTSLATLRLEGRLGTGREAPAGDYGDYRERGELAESLLRDCRPSAQVAG
jgi:hypothetical protein